MPRVVSIGKLGYLQASWSTRAVIFIDALAEGRLADTCLTAHPGVTTMWLLGASLALAARFAGPLRPSQQLRIIDLAQILWSTGLLLLLFHTMRGTLARYGEPRRAAAFAAWGACVLLSLYP